MNLRSGLFKRDIKPKATTGKNSKDSTTNTVESAMADQEARTGAHETPENTSNDDIAARLNQVMNKLSLLDSIHTKLTSFEEKFKGFENDLSELRTSVNTAHETANDASEGAFKALNTAQQLEKENSSLKQEVSTLKHKLIQQETQSRRNNLLFYGVPEQEWEKWSDCEKSISNIIKTNMGITDGDKIKFERVHRLGLKSANRSRPILAKFCYFKDREIVWHHGRKLAKSNYKLSEDFPIEVLNERKVLYPIYKAADNNKRYKTVSLKVDKLHVDNKVYTSKNLHELPDDLKPAQLATRTTDKVALFASKHSPLSNFYSENLMTIEMRTYCSTEQYYQFEKAKFFKDDVTAEKILAESDPQKIYVLGKRISNCNEAMWEPHACDVLLRANREKFAQVLYARDTLLSTNKLSIGVATKDPKFGIGFHINDPSAFDETKWTGKNLFGNVLKQIRSELQTAQIVS